LLNDNRLSKWVAQVSLLRPGCFGRQFVCSRQNGCRGLRTRLRPTYPGANTGPDEFLGPRWLEGKTCGIPHLAKNERDVGHPAMISGIEFEAVPSFNRDGDGDRVAGRAVGYLNLECDSPGAIWDCPFLQVIPQIQTGSITFQGQTGRDDSWAPSLSQLGTRSAMLRRRRT
jgi:hypothetical protein